MSFTRTQRIGGEAALALPDADVETLWLDFSAEEKLLYQRAACLDGVPTWARINDKGRPSEAPGQLAALTGLTHRLRAAAGLFPLPPPKDAPAQSAFDKLMHTPASADSTPWQHYGTPNEHFAEWPKLLAHTKYLRLFADLDKLRAEQPDVSVVCFTQFESVHSALTKLLQERGGFQVFSVSQATAPLRRHKAIKEFQGGQEASDDQPVKPRKNPVQKSVSSSSAASASVKTSSATESWVEERRVDASDGSFYTKQEFLDEYGGLAEWNASPLVAPSAPPSDAETSSATESWVAERRVDASDGNAYTKQEFLDEYGGLAEWNESTLVAPHSAVGHVPASRRPVRSAAAKASTRLSSLGEGDDDDGDVFEAAKPKPVREKAASKPAAAGSTKKPQAKIFLCTYSVCAVGVTLTQASRIYLLVCHAAAQTLDYSLSLILCSSLCVDRTCLSTLPKKHRVRCNRIRPAPDFLRVGHF